MDEKRKNPRVNGNAPVQRQFFNNITKDLKYKDKMELRLPQDCSLYIVLLIVNISVYFYCLSLKNSLCNILVCDSW